MQSVLQLPPRRYTVLDSLGISFRVAPVAAFFYGFFELAAAALIPVATLAAARLIDAVVSSVRDGAPVQPVYRWLILLAALTAFGWLKSAMHNFADLKLVLALRARYRTALTEKRARLEYRLLEQSETWDLIQRAAANPEGGRLKATYFHLVDLAAFIIKVGGLMAILASTVWWLPLAVIAVAGAALFLGVRGGKALYSAEREAAEHDRRLNYLGDVMLGREAAAERNLTVSPTAPFTTRAPLTINSVCVVLYPPAWLSVSAMSRCVPDPRVRLLPAGTVKSPGNSRVLPPATSASRASVPYMQATGYAPIGYPLALFPGFPYESTRRV